MTARDHYRQRSLIKNKKNLALLKTDLSPKEVILALLIKHLIKLSCENSSSTRAVFN